MSKLNGNHIFDEGHGEDLVSYIYGEMPAADRNEFEAHLSHCDDCVVELAAFSDARLGVIEWRREDFEHLATPEIHLPRPQVAAVKPVTENSNSGFTAWLGALGSLSNLARAGLGLAAAALAITIIYFAAFSPARSKEVATNSSAVVEIPSIPAQTEIPRSNEPVSAPYLEPRKEVATQTIRQVRDEYVQRSRAARNATRPVLPPSRKAETAVKQNAPRLNSFEEDDDRSLRLSDLFAEVGSDGGE
jgi:hypothetical protein